ncbi:hypothetical protein M0813_20754 [Anaeramoeba flamelloides]|uniref:MULE transposase domain-containing protein n=1 Tax=Anaeramoeba flamelloides TaxID=1746091 RepID=A0ABQ8YKD0_9EUKA|nr:hypothetical protein M0813_20754 [Anaeramoeba flamelloides]
MYLGCPENKCLSKGVLRCVNKNGKLIYVLSIKGAHCHMNSKTNFELSVLDEIKIIEDLSKTSLSPEQIVLQIKKNRSEGLIKNDGILCESSEDIKKRVYKFRKKKEKFVDSNLILNEELSKTEKNTPFIRLDIKGDFPLILMATNQQLSLLTNNNQIFVDGTYLVCPREYTSLYTIMTFDNETQMYIPYFAKSNINAIKITFPFSKVHGCGFHFLQAIKRKLMKSKIENQEKVLKKIKSFMTLSTEEIKKRLEEWINKLNLKTNEIENWNMEIENLEKKIEKNSFENYENLSNIETGGPRNVLVLDEKYSKNFKFFQSKIEQKEIEKSTLKDFLQNYFYNTWIKRFNPELWSIYYKKQEIFFSKMIDATNNPLESWHNVLGGSLNRLKPSLINLIRTLKYIEFKKRTDRSAKIGNDQKLQTRTLRLPNRIKNDNSIKLTKDINKLPNEKIEFYGKSAYTCSVCKRKGHTKASKLCPLYLQNSKKK